MHDKKLIVELFDRFIEAGGDYRYDIVKRFNELYDSDKNNPENFGDEESYLYYKNKSEINLILYEDKSITIEIINESIQIYLIERSFFENIPILEKYIFKYERNMRYSYAKENNWAEKYQKNYFNGITVYFDDFQDFSTAFRDYVFEELNIIKNI